MNKVILHFDYVLGTFSKEFISIKKAIKHGIRHAPSEFNLEIYNESRNISFINYFQNGFLDWRRSNKKKGTFVKGKVKLERWE